MIFNLLLLWWSGAKKKVCSSGVCIYGGKLLLVGRMKRLELSPRGTKNIYELYTGTGRVSALV
jgi:hypothetical protein